MVCVGLVLVLDAEVVVGFAYNSRHVVRTAEGVDNAVGPQVLPRFSTVLGSFVPQPLDKESSSAFGGRLNLVGV